MGKRESTKLKNCIINSDVFLYMGFQPAIEYNE